MTARPQIRTSYVRTVLVLLFLGLIFTILCACILWFCWPIAAAAWGGLLSFGGETLKLLASPAIFFMLSLVAIHVAGLAAYCFCLPAAIFGLWLVIGACAELLRKQTYYEDKALWVKRWQRDAESFITDHGYTNLITDDKPLTIADFKSLSLHAYDGLKVRPIFSTEISGRLATWYGATMGNTLVKMVMRVELGTSVPSAILINKTTISPPMPKRFSNGRAIHLPGDIDDYFSCVAHRGDEVEILGLLTPDVVQAAVMSADLCNIELADRHVDFSWPGDIKDSIIIDHQNKVATFVKELMEQVRHAPAKSEKATSLRPGPDGFRVATNGAVKTAKYATVSMFCIGVVHAGVIGLLDGSFGISAWLGIPIMVLVGALLVSLVLLVVFLLGQGCVIGAVTLYRSFQAEKSRHKFIFYYSQNQ